jgi:hypothetical protein
VVTEPSVGQVRRNTIARWRPFGEVTSDLTWLVHGAGCLEEQAANKNPRIIPENTNAQGTEKTQNFDRGITALCNLAAQFWKTL